jgi:hypothetical protein
MRISYRTPSCQTRACASIRLQSAQEFAQSPVECSCQSCNRVEPSLGAPALHLDNRVLGKATMHGKIGKTSPSHKISYLIAKHKPPFVRRMRCISSTKPESHGQRTQSINSGTASVRDLRSVKWSIFIAGVSVRNRGFWYSHAPSGRS